jgi:hypothetical protein
MKKVNFFKTIFNLFSIEFQNIQNIKIFFILEAILFVIGFLLMISIKKLSNINEYANEIFNILMITIPASAIFQAYKIYRKSNWIKIGNKNINVPLYLESIKRKYKHKKEEYSVKEEIISLYENFLEKEKKLKNELNTCKTFNEFEKIIKPQLQRLKNIQRPILFTTGKEYVEEHYWYLSLLLHLKDDLDLYNYEIKIKEYIQGEIDIILSKHHYDEDELEHIKYRKDYSKYLVKMNQLVRNLNRYYCKFLDNKDGYNEKIKKLEQLLSENPDLDEFINNAILKIEKEKEDRWNDKLDDLELENYFIMKYKNQLKND